MAHSAALVASSSHPQKTEGIGLVTRQSPWRRLSPSTGLGAVLATAEDGTRGGDCARLTKTPCFVGNGFPGGIISYSAVYNV